MVIGVCKVSSQRFKENVVKRVSREREMGLKVSETNLGVEKKKKVG